jgi:hypothetical protein
MPQAKPAGVTGGNRSILITAWKPHSKNTLTGFVSCVLPSGMIVHGLTIHRKNDARWVGMPSKEWINDQGAKQYTPILEFTTRIIAGKFRDGVLAALDQYLLEQQEENESAALR